MSDAANKAAVAADKVNSAADVLHRRVRLLLFVTVVLLALAVAQQVQMTRLNDNVNDIEDAVAVGGDAVQELDEFAHSLVEPDTPEEQAQNQAVSDAVLRLIPEIHRAVCTMTGLCTP
ncbi:MAG: hypothetical protein ACRD0W_17160 [Acidimicrobiales bacterium]